MHELIKKIKQFRQERDWDQYHSPKNLVMALSVEVAELVEHFQWLTQEESRNLPDAKLDQVRDEIGDILIYLANLSEKLGIDPVQAAHAKIEKNQIKYPAEIVKGKHSKYSEYD
ncbi:MAG: nucleotide pyrophosphohydrolase [Desulfobacterales bacterium]|jgi:NTP pyrophosphatase (non-canonical NTP hydrolase)